MKVDQTKLTFSPLSDNDNLRFLDFTKEDGSDPLGVDNFAKEKAVSYHNNKLSTVWVVRYENELVAFFSLSMFAIEIGKLAEVEKVVGATPRSYPAILLGQMGVDKRHRGLDIGYWICEFCLGLAQEMGRRIACRYVVLQTNKCLLSFYQDKAGFIPSETITPDGRIWMYRRIF